RSNTANAISNFVIMLVVLLSLGFLFAFTNNFTTPLKNFYVQCGKVTFTHEFENYNLELGKEHIFEIHNTLGGKDDGYVVSIKPNETATTTFTFKVDDVETNYADLNSLAKGFSIVTYEDYFVLTANMDLPEMLQLYYPNSTLADIPNVVDSGLPYFTLSVSSGSMSETINIHFNIKSEMIP
ncbi:MAG: hypothetical protein ACLRFL_01900, partial [Clostridia bacterium]